MKKHLLWILVLVASFCEGRQVICMSSGTWGSPGTWSATPTCGDTLFIPSDKTVTVDAQYTYLCPTSSMKIIVAGVLQFQNGYKLSLPCNSQVEILVGAVLKKATAGGGYSTLIEICQTTVWSAGEGPIPGYELLYVGVLPVSWLKIQAERNGSGVRVNWSTASEYNNDYFQVERTADLTHFVPVGYRDGAGTSSIATSYQFVDELAPSGTLYYRIRQVDFDGKSSYSSLVAVKDGSDLGFSLIDVKSQENNQINIRFTEPEQPNCNFHLLDVSGRMIASGTLEAGVGMLERSMTCTSLKPGEMYVLHLTNGKESASRRFVIE